MHVEVIHPAELGDVDFERWHNLRAASGLLDNPFIGPDFSACVGSVRNDARIAILEQGGETIGYFPHERHRSGVIRSIGFGLSDYQALVLAPGADLDVAALLRACGARSWEFDHLAEPLGPLLSGAHHRSSREVSPAIDLREGYDAYLDGRRQASKGLVQNSTRKRRKLAREVGPVQLRLAEPGDGSVEQLMRWKSLQYRATGRRDRFARGWIRSLLHHLLEASTPRAKAELHVLVAGERPVAWHLGLRSPSVLASWFPAYDSQLGAYSPGLILLLELAERLADEGCELLDLGKGDESHKERLANTSVGVLSGHVDASATTAAILGLRRRPKEAAMGVVLGNPQLRRAARTALAAAGSVRSRLRSDEV